MTQPTKLGMLVVLVAVVVSLGLFSGSCYAQTWDPWAEFSVDSNPNGPWSYGQTPNLNPGYTLTLYTVSGIAGQPGAWPGFPAALAGIEYWDTTWLVPAVFRNPTDQDISASGWGSWRANALQFHPGANNVRSVIRWTAPVSGAAKLSGTFWGECRTDPQILINGVSLWHAYVEKNTQAFSLLTPISTDDKIDFSVGWGSDNTHGGDLTQFIGSIEVTQNAGVVRGTVRSTFEGNPAVVGATVVIGSESTTTNKDGAYSLIVPAGEQPMAVSAFGFVSYEGTVTVANASQQMQPDVLLSPSGEGHVYYVKPDGDDENDGLSLENAWATIDNGDRLGVLKFDDTILVQPGVYGLREIATGVDAAAEITERSGMPGHPITYKADNRDGLRVVIDGLDSTADRKYGIAAKSHNLVFDGFEIANCTVGVILSSGASKVTVKNCYVHDMIPDATGGYCSGFRDVTLTSGNLFHNNVVCGPNDILVDSSGIYTQGATNTRICNNTVIDVLNGVGIYQSTGVDVVNNIIVNCSLTGIFSHSSSSSTAHSYNMFYENAKNIDGLSPGEGELTADPMFLDPWGLNGTPDYSLLSDSVAINTGKDVGLPFAGPAPDRGAFESDNESTPTMITGTVTASLQGNLPVPAIVVRTTDAQYQTSTLDDGTYLLPVVPGTQVVEAIGEPWLLSTEEATVTVAASQTEVQDFVLDPLPGIGKTYYVRPASEGGSDSNDGLTPETAWANIDNGDIKRLLKPADTVIIMAGSYAPHTHPWGYITAADIRYCSGNQFFPVTYKADPAASTRPILQGPMASSGAYSFGVAVIDASYIVVDGLEARGWWQGLFIGYTTHHATVKNCVVRDIDLHSVTKWSAGISENSEPNRGRPRDNVYHNNVVLYEPTGGTPLDIRGFSLQYSDSARVLNNTVVGPWRSIVTYRYPTNTEIRNNILVDAGWHALAPIGAVGTQNSHNLFFNNAANWSGVGAGFGEFTADPQFENPAANNYALRSTSLAINAGVDVGMPFNGIAPDIGAIESSTTTGGPGFLRGTVTDASSGAPLGGAIVRCTDGTVSTETGTDGNYSVALAAGDQTVEVSKLGYVPQLANVSIVADASIVRDFALQLGTAYSKISECRALPDGTPIRLVEPKSATVATGVFSDGRYYIEEPDRVAGIKVVGGSAVSLGDRLTISGVVGTDANGEKMITVTAIESKSAGDALAPVAVSCRTMSGGSVAGLLVRTWGRVVSKATDGSYVTIDDGSGTPVMVMLTGLTTPIASLVEQGDYAGVTGLAGWAKVEGISVPTVRPRDSGDVNTF